MTLSLLPYLFISYNELFESQYVLLTIFVVLFTAIYPMGYAMLFLMAKFNLGKPAFFRVTEVAVYTETKCEKPDDEPEFFINEIKDIKIEKIKFQGDEFYLMEVFLNPLRTTRRECIKLKLSCDFIENKLEHLLSILKSKAPIKQLWKESTFVD
ncbi:hypothetical protein SAMN05660429_00274 [Thalassotalea agarivorans]|uniref:Uncharacterized protein n=2 Tax=Thalassotalea agarivorans TaxID=349064 RepID=A0A1H9YLX6_THASX|nr:hypothetical protein SAMN05660429_00274 [Thalassotalea agarivorans]